MSPIKNLLFLTVLSFVEFFEASGRVLYEGHVGLDTGTINGGFRCSEMTDAFIDEKLDNACDEVYSGSRNIRQLELEDGSYQNIVGLPPNPVVVFVPSCDGCNDGCDVDGTRLCSWVSSWDINDGTWLTNHIGYVLRGECVTDCDVIYAGSIPSSIDGGFRCSQMTDAFIDAKLDNACNEEYPGSRNIRQSELEDGSYQDIIGLPPNPVVVFVPSCDGCDDGCDADGTRLCSWVSSWDINDGTWLTNHVGNVLRAECVYDVCGDDGTNEPTEEPTEEPY